MKTMGLRPESEAERGLLVGCVAEGATARLLGITSDRNPYLPSATPQVTMVERLVALQIEAWWDGWAEIELAEQRKARKDVLF